MQPPTVEPPPLKLVCFDLDGTLIPSTTVSAHLAEWLGHSSALQELETAYAGGSISNRVVAEQSARYYSGISTSEIEHRLESIPLISGIAETVQWLREQGALVLLATITWRFAAEFFGSRFGFDAVCGCTMTTDPTGVLSGRVDRHFEAAQKVAFVNEFAERHGIAPEECAAIGDGRSDIPLFREVGVSVAINASPAARKTATVALETHDLQDLIPILRRRFAI